MKSKKTIKKYKQNLFIFLAICITVLIVSYIRAFLIMPGSMTLLEGEEYIYDFKSPFSVVVKADNNDVLRVNDKLINANGNYLNLFNPIQFNTQKYGSVLLNMRLFGIIPLKTMQINVMPNRKILVCGNTIGVKLQISGILVIGISDVETLDGKKMLPAKDGGVKTGDLLIEANNTKLYNVDDLIKEIDNSNGSYIKLKYKRGNIYINIDLKPVIAVEDKKYHIGLWVRDSTAGIGTLTFYDPETRCFGALGHGITDIDTGTLMPVESGEILESNILAIKKGQQGNPGELKGVFIEDKNKLGMVKQNTNHGIFGVLNEGTSNNISAKPYPIALQSQVKEGHATILANIDGRRVDEYDIEIERVSKQNMSSSKGMIIRIVDRKLLEETGGIVQGMSGSPIIQNGRIIGAVTHVLVNDPTRGYGIFIEWMLKNLSSNNKSNFSKAS